MEEKADKLIEEDMWRSILSNIYDQADIEKIEALIKF